MRNVKEKNPAINGQPIDGIPNLNGKKIRLVPKHFRENTKWNDEGNQHAQIL